jgi:hypothetical protein
MIIIVMAIADRPLFEQMIAVKTGPVHARLTSDCICRCKEHDKKHSHRQKKKCHSGDPFSQLTAVTGKSSVSTSLDTGPCLKQP